jgi:hypothetical protein
MVVLERKPPLGGPELVGVHSTSKLSDAGIKHMCEESPSEGMALSSASRQL